MKGGRERVFITGAGGFIGAALARAEITAGNDVHLLLRSPTLAYRLADILARCVVHRGDLLDAAGIGKVASTCRPDIVYHLAAAGANRAAKATRLDLVRANVLGTANLLEALAEVPYRALVQVGSGAEYGWRDHPVEEGGPVDPQTDYAATKAAATALCQAEARSGRPVVTVRVFGAYGPGEAPERLLPYVLGCCRRGERPKLSAGTQRRDFVHVEDVVALLRRAAETLAAKGQVLHAASGNAYSVREVVAELPAICGRLVQPIFSDAPPGGEPPLYQASIARTVALTGWKPHYDLRSGLARTWAWFQSTEPARAA